MKTQKLHKHICILLAMMMTVSVACGVLFATGGRAAVRNAPEASQDEITTVKTRGGGDQTTGAQDPIDEAKIADAVSKINAIGEVTYSAVSRARIRAARSAYDALNRREKQLVGNYGTLLIAENTFSNLAQEHNIAIRLVSGNNVVGFIDPGVDRVYFGAYNQRSNAFTDPVLWRVLNVSGGMMLMLSDKTLLYERFHVNSTAAVTWSSCALHTRLNGSSTGVVGGTDNSFVAKAFDSAENSAIWETDILSIDNPGGASQGGMGFGSGDKVFILSSVEAINEAYGFSGSTAPSDTRAAQSSAVVALASSSNGAELTWWLRDTRSGTSRWVKSTGEVAASSDTDNYNQNDYRGVRPALNINLEKVLLFSPAAGGKNANGALAAVPQYTGNEWKLTVRDNSYNFTVTQTEATAGRGETVTLNYTKAKYGSNDRISAILVNEDGNPVYYGQIAHPTAAAGSVDIPVPQDIIPGNYTLRVFNEQLNGDYATDYTSAFSDVALTVPCRHNWEQSSITGSCKTSITRYFTCRICGETYTETEAGSGSHTWQEARREGSDEDGWTVWYYCTVCEAAWTKIIEPEHRQLNEAIVAIESIGKVEYTQECAALIDNARTKYNELPARFKPLVTNYSDLTDAEAKYAALAQGITDEPDPPAVCEYCGEVHTGFFGKIETFFHRFLRFLGLVNLLPDSPEEEPVSIGF